MTLGIVRASKILTKLTYSSKHEVTALSARLLRNLIAIGRRTAKVSFKAGVEIPDNRTPVHTALFDIVKTIFHVCRKADVHDVFKTADKHIHNVVGNGGRHHVLAVLLDVFLHQLGNNRCVGGRSTDTLFFHRFNDGCVRITQGRGGEFLFLLQGN